MKHKKTKTSFLKRALKWGIYAVIALIGLSVILYLSAGHLIKIGVQTYVPKVTQTTASVEDVDLSLLSGKITITGLKIGNPVGFDSPTLFELGKIDVRFQPLSILSNKLVINHVLIDKTRASIEMNSHGTLNLTQLNQNVQHALGGNTSQQPKAVEQAAPAPKKSAGKTVVIQDLKINNSSLKVGVMGQMMTVPLPDIHKTGIGEDGQKRTLGETVALILFYFSNESLQALKNSTNQLIQQGLSGVGHVAEGGRQAAESGINSIKNAAHDVTDGLKGLFK